MKGCIWNYKEKVLGNWKAGLTVAMINIPLSISLAVASGGTPLQGIITGIWATIFAAIFASSKYNIFWVAGALTSIILTFVIANGAMGIYLIPLLAIVSWVIILVVYFLKITKYITLLPSSVLHWFLMSVGISIALSQLSWALGLNHPDLQIPTHKEIYYNLYEIVKHISQVNLYAFWVFLVWLISILITKKKFPQFPIVIVVSIVWIGLGLLTAKGMLPSMLLLTDKYPQVSFSIFSNPLAGIEVSSLKDYIDILRIVFYTSLTIAIIAILETIISAKIAEKMTKKPFNKDKEVLGLWISNIGSGILWGMPVSAVFIRTALNIKSWASSRMSAFLVGIFTLLISALLFNGYFKYIPFPVISAILMSIAIGLIDIGLLKKVFHTERKAFYIILITIFLSVLEEPTYGILVGTSLSLLVFLKWVYNSRPTINIFRDKKFYAKLPIKTYLDHQKDGDVLVIKLPWGLNYINIENFFGDLKQITWKKDIIFSCSTLGELDIDGFEAFEEIVEHMDHSGMTVKLTGVNEEILTALLKLKCVKHIESKGHIYASTSEAIDKL